ncbi:MAG: metallophosphoesterase [Propionibacteriaceae bacterium]|jgi:predicted MPP superfamily phosphohydrolase|nr:metallophosphoesterase [Propionibacteriaceae bacterium]
MNPWTLTALVVVDLLFLLFCLTKLVRLRKLWAIVTTSVLAVLCLATVLANTLIRYGGVNKDWLRMPLRISAAVAGFLAYLTAGLVIVCLVSGIWWLVTRKAKPTLRAARAIGDSERLPRLRVVRILTTAVIAGALAATGWGYVHAQSPTLTYTQIRFADLPPSFEGFTIALISDLHLNVTIDESWLPGIVAEVNAAKPDLIVIAGDTANGCLPELESRASALAKLRAPYGVLLTLGNHDLTSCPAQWIDRYTSWGIRVLNNDGLVIERGRESIWVLGITDRAGKADLKPNLQQAWDRVAAVAPEEAPLKILIAHKPVQVKDNDGLAASLGIDLMLSGHTHGGQIWPFGVRTLLGQPALGGVHVIDGVTVAISRGVGTSFAGIRVGARPEIPLITLAS